MKVIRRRVVLVVALSIAIFTSSSSLLAGINSVPKAFAAGEWFVITDSSAPTIFSSQIDENMVDALREISNVTGASPEILTFSSWNGVSFVVRGMGGGFGDIAWPSLLADGQVVPGPDERFNATIGDALLKKLGIGLPCILPLAGSFTAKMDFVTVTEHFSTGTPLDDELVVPLVVARHLADIPEGKVSIIRVSTTDAPWLAGLLSPKTARFVISDMTVSRALVAENQPLIVSVTLRNWGSVPGSQRVEFSADGVTLSNATASLNASASTVLQRSIVLEGLGVHVVECTISGGFPVRLSENVTVAMPFLQISTPGKVISGSSFNVTVTKFDGKLGDGSTVRFQGQTVQANATGKAMLLAGAEGTYPLTASLAGYTNASSSVSVVNSSAYPSIFRPMVSSFVLGPQSIEESEEARGTIVAENAGKIAGTFTVNITLDSASYTHIDIFLAGMGSSSGSFVMKGLAPGTHMVQVGNFSAELQVRAWYADKPDLVNLVLRHGGSSHLASSNAIPVYQAGKLSQANIAAILFSIGAISALLAVLSITSVFRVEVDMARRSLGIARTAGASASDVRRIVFPQAFVAGLAGGAIGVAVGLTIAVLLSRAGVFSVLTHRLELDVDLVLVAIIILGAVTISLVSALASAMNAARERPTSSMKGLEEEIPEPKDVNALLGQD